MKNKKMDHKEKFDHIASGGNGYTLKEMLAIHMQSSKEFRKEVLTKIDEKVSKDMYWKITGVYTTVFVVIITYILTNLGG